MKNVVRKVISSLKGDKLEHPAGLRLVISKGVFSRDSQVEIISEAKAGLIYAYNAFRISSTEVPAKPIDISVKLDRKPGQINKKAIPFLEIREGSESVMLAGKLQERTVGAQKEYHVAARYVPFKIERNVSVGAGIFEDVSVERTFHPVQHQFKIRQDCLDMTRDGSVSRRRNELGDQCDDRDDVREEGEIFQKDIYPACYPAAWAALCSSYRMTPLHPRRRWEMGTPDEPNPLPNEFGDFFSTWAMGTEKVHFQNNPDPPVTRVEDWSANPVDPTPDKIAMVHHIFEWPDPNNITPVDRSRRDALIKATLIKEVGLTLPSQSASIFLDTAHPVWMAHTGHAWVVVGVDKKGFWSHSWDGSFALSNYCLWTNAPWTDHDSDLRYAIYYPPHNCGLKPEDRRLGCISLEGSSDMKEHRRVRFQEVHNGREAIVINWTPHTRTDPGYLWIPGDVPLNCEGFPERPSDRLFDKDLFGHRIPRPLFNHGDCPMCNNIKGGCKYCRLHLLLPFYVHNTTLDEEVTYKVDLYFWSKDRRWVTLNAKSLPETSGSIEDELYCGFDLEDENGEQKGHWIDYNLPGPLPGEYFSKKAERDTDTTKARDKPYSSQGFAWYIDFHRDQLDYNAIQGIRLVLTCGRRSSKPLCLVQDVKQIWFRIGESL